MRFWLPALAAFTVAASAHAAPALLQAPWRSFDTGETPRMAPAAMATGDVDGDGDLDLLVGRWFYGGPGVSVLFNLNGTYGPPVHYDLPAQRCVADVKLADFDGDGDLDAFATTPDSNGLTNLLAVWRNNGAGALSGRVDFSTGPGPQGLELVDVNRDGFLDAVTANYGYIAGQNSNISVLLHNGASGATAAFLTPVQHPVGARPEKIAAADLNGDGAVDLAIARVAYPDPGDYLTDVIDVLMNNGAGGFGAATAYTSVPTPHHGGRAAVALADIDRDGDADLIGGGGRDAGSLSVGFVSVRRNSGAGQFGPVELLELSSGVYAPRQVTTADLNQDGWPDILASSPTGRAGDTWNLLLNNGAGSFQPAQRFEAGKQTYQVLAADVDGDVDLDVLTVANDSAVITVHENLGAAQFLQAPHYAVGGLTENVAAADLDGDGDLDITTIDTQVRVLRNRGDGTFDAAQTYSPPRDYFDIKLRDLNGDGLPDLLLGPDSEAPPYHFATSLNLGNGTFGPGVIQPVGSCGTGTIDAFDFDNDGDLDVVLTEEQGCAGGAPPRIFLFRNVGPQQFQAAPVILPPGFATGINAGDFDHDGNIDLVTSLGQGVGVFRGNGDMSFQAPLSSAGRPYKFDVADFNKDGDLDVGMLHIQDSFGTVSVEVALGNGDGTFATQSIEAGATGLESAFRIADDVDAGDIDGDGFPDLVASNNASNDVSVFLGNGDGTLRPHERYGAGYSAQRSVLGDFDDDGALDVASVIATGPFGFSSDVVLLFGRGPAAAPGDMNCDGVVSVSDIGLFVMALTQPQAYAAAQPDCDIQNGDLSGDGVVTVSDIGPFVAMLTGGR